GGDHDLLGLIGALATTVPAAGTARREGDRGAAAGRAPGDGQLELALGLARDLDPPASRALAEACDASSLRSSLGLGRCIGAQAGGLERTDHQHLLLVHRYRWRSREPALREPSGKPTCDLVEFCLFHDYNITLQEPASWRRLNRRGSGAKL